MEAGISTDESLKLSARLQNTQASWDHVFIWFVWTDPLFHRDLNVLLYHLKALIVLQSQQRVELSWSRVFSPTDQGRCALAASCWVTFLRLAHSWRELLRFSLCSGVDLCCVTADLGLGPPNSDVPLLWTRRKSLWVQIVLLFVLSQISRMLDQWFVRLIAASHVPCSLRK